MRSTFQIWLSAVSVAWVASPAWPASEDLEVQRVIREAAEAYVAFPQTRDRHSVTKYFAPDYSFFDDIGARSFQDIERMLADLEQDLARGPVVITEQITHITVHQVDRTLAWATYQDRVTVVRLGRITEDEALCTAIFHKTLTGWVYQHEHCSSPMLDNEPVPDELTKLT